MLKFHLTGAGLIVGAAFLALMQDYMVAAMCLYCAVQHAKGVSHG